MPLKVKSRIIETECGRRFEVVPEEKPWVCSGCDALVDRVCLFGHNHRLCGDSSILKEVKDV